MKKHTDNLGEREREIDRESERERDKWQQQAFSSEGHRSFLLSRSGSLRHTINAKSVDPTNIFRDTQPVHHGIKARPQQNSSNKLSYSSDYMTAHTQRHENWLQNLQELVANKGQLHSAVRHDLLPHQIWTKVDPLCKNGDIALSPMPAKV